MRTPTPKSNHPLTIRRAIQRLSGTSLDEGSTPKFGSVLLTDLTASQFVMTDADKKLVSEPQPLVAGKGGTGVTTLTDGGIVLGSGTNPVTVLGQATNGQIPIGSTGGDPVLATLTGTVNQVNVANASGSITLSLEQDYDTGATPTLGGLTIVNAITEFSTDGTLGDNSDNALPTEKAVKTYADAAVGPGGHTHDTDTLQLDGINSDGGAFSFTTTGAVTFNQNIVVPNGGTIGQAAGPLLTFDDTNNHLEITGIDRLAVGTATALSTWWFEATGTYNDLYVRSLNASGRAMFQQSANSAGNYTPSISLRAHGPTYTGDGPWMGVAMAGTACLFSQPTATGLLIGTLTNLPVIVGVNNNQVAQFTTAGHFIPAADNTHDLGLVGGTDYRWRHLYLSGNLSDETNSLSVSDIQDAYDHMSATGASHSYINQDVTTSGTPTFAGLTVSKTSTTVSATRLVNLTYTASNTAAQTWFSCIQAMAKHSGSGGISGNMTGGTFTAQLSGTGTVALARGGSYNIYNTSTGAGAITTARTLDVNVPYIPSNGTIGTLYGLYVGAQSHAQVTTAYGIYAAGTSDTNYIGGNTGIGTASPDTVLHLKASAPELRFESSAGDIVDLRASSTGAFIIEQNLDAAAKHIYIRPTMGGQANTKHLVVCDEGGKLGVGVVPSTNGGALVIDGTCLLKEQASADSDTAAYGQIWVKNTSPCELWFTDDAGTDTQLTEVDKTMFVIPASSMYGDNDAQLVAGDAAAPHTTHNSRSVLAFDDTDEEAAVTPELVMPRKYRGGTLKATVHFYMESDNTNDVALDVFVEAKTPNTDTLDLEAATSWDSANSGTMSLAGTTAGDPLSLTITLTNADSVAAGDLVRFGIRRDCDSANDDASDDLFVASIEIWEDC